MKKTSASYVESACQLKEGVGLTSAYERSLETCESCSIVVQGTVIGLEKIKDDRIRGNKPQRRIADDVLSICRGWKYDMRR